MKNDLHPRRGRTTLSGMLEWLRIVLLRLLPSPVVRAVEGFWAIPIALSVFGVGLAFAVHWLPEGAMPTPWREYFDQIDVAGSRSALSVIAGGMVSLVTLVFSLTFVALSITAQQLSPRILDYVMRDRSAQVLLGMALTTLLYCAIVLNFGAAQGAWRLGLAMPPAVLMAAASLLMVVIFAHRMTRVMRAEELVARLGNEFVADMHILLDPPTGCVASGAEAADFEERLSEARKIDATTAGYVGLIDYSGLLEFAGRNDLLIALEVRESNFILPGTPVARVAGVHESERPLAVEIEDALNLSDRREMTDTAGYEAAALCEAALRALSPGINDPATAMSCLNRIFEGLAVLVEGPEPPRLLCSDSGDAGAAPRLLRPHRGVPEFLQNVVEPIIAAARGDNRVYARIDALAGQLEEIATRARELDAIRVLRRKLAAARAGTP